MDWLISALFPRFCLGCSAEGGLLCSSCRRTWWHEPPKPSEEHLAFYAYANPLVRQLICTWKYQYDHSAWEILREHALPLLPALKARVEKNGIQAIVPLPLSPRRERERGFNQSMMIAAWLSQELKIPVMPMLTRAHRSGHQAERNEQERRKAMENSPFVLTSNSQLSAPASVLLVDDVWTTGATIGAAKNALITAGILQVMAFTLAQG